MDTQIENEQNCEFRKQQLWLQMMADYIKDTIPPNKWGKLEGDSNIDKVVNYLVEKELKTKTISRVIETLQESGKDFSSVNIVDVNDLKKLNIKEIIGNRECSEENIDSILCEYIPEVDWTSIKKNTAYEKLVYYLDVLNDDKIKIRDLLRELVKSSKFEYKTGIWDRKLYRKELTEKEKLNNLLEIVEGCIDYNNRAKELIAERIPEVTWEQLKGNSVVDKLWYYVTELNGSTFVVKDILDSLK